MICGVWRPGETRFDAELFGAPVAQVLEYRDQGLPSGAEGIGDLRRRGANFPSLDDPIPFQFAELRSKNFFTDAAQEIAELGEAQRAKRKTPHGLDFPLTAQDIDGRLNGTALMNLHGALRAYKFVRTSPMQTVVIPWARSIRLAGDGLDFAFFREPHKTGARK